MSCGRPHKTSCSEVIAEVFLFLDEECNERRRRLIHEHLEECAPCLRMYGIEEEVKALVHRCCGGDQAPASLKDRIRLRLSEATATEVTITEVTMELRAD
ncbi:MAG TPA: mycothiol system anti-sigma-R factor [Mycobacteriales bacterium]|nr:mycothiol system anti-sigma-R factor [Mycobacteriales bacterium]